MIDDLITQTEVCEAFKISRQTLYRWRKDMFFPAPIQLTPNSIRFRMADIEDWLEYHRKLTRERELERGGS